MRVAIVIPAKDEEKTIGEVVRSLVREGWKDVFVVDDESLDRTAEVALRTGADIIKLPVALGAFGAIQVGMRYALEKGFDVVVTVDGDMQHKVEFVKNLVEKISKGYDVVIGSCISRGGLLKKSMWKILKVLSGLECMDLTSGFRAYSRNAVETLLMDESFVLEYQDVGVLIICKKKGLKVVEVPVEMNERAHGKSRVFPNIVSILKYTVLTTLYAGINRW